MKTRCYDGKKWQYEFKHEGKRYESSTLNWTNSMRIDIVNLRK